MLLPSQCSIIGRASRSCLPYHDSYSSWSRLTRSNSPEVHRIHALARSVPLAPPLSRLCVSELPAIRKHIGPHQYPMAFHRRIRVKSIKRTAVCVERRRGSYGVVSVKAWLCILLFVDCGAQNKKISHYVLHGRNPERREGIHHPQ